MGPHVRFISYSHPSLSIKNQQRGLVSMRRGSRAAVAGVLCWEADGIGRGMGRGRENER
jgi:hypothetical protein